MISILTDKIAGASGDTFRKLRSTKEPGMKIILNELR